MYERFTDRARKVMHLAHQEAQRFRHESIGTEHILLGLIQEGAGVAANVLKNLGADPPAIRREVERILQPGDPGDRVVAGRLPHTPRARKIIECSIEEARTLGHNYVGTEHLLLGMLREREGVAAQVLTNLGLEPEAVRREVLAIFGTDPAPGRVSPGPARDSGASVVAPGRFGRDLVALARRADSGVPPGRAAEVERVLRVMAMPGAASPAIIGDYSEVGGVVGGVASRIAAGSSGLPAPVWLIELTPGKVARTFRAGGGWLFARGADRLAGAAFRARFLGGEIRVVWGLRADEFRAARAADPDWAAAVEPVVLGARPDADLVAELSSGVRLLCELRLGVRVADDAVAEAVGCAPQALPDWPHAAAAGHLLRAAAAAVSRRRAESPPDWVPFDVQIERLNAGKEQAVAAGDIETAAALREEVRRLRAELAGPAVSAADVGALAGELRAGAALLADPPM